MHTGFCAPQCLRLCCARQTVDARFTLASSTSVSFPCGDQRLLQVPTVSHVELQLYRTGTSVGQMPSRRRRRRSNRKSGRARARMLRRPLRRRARPRRPQRRTAHPRRRASWQRRVLQARRMRTLLPKRQLQRHAAEREQQRAVARRCSAVLATVKLLYPAVEPT